MDARENRIGAPLVWKGAMLAAVDATESRTAPAVRERFVELVDRELDRAFRIAGLILGTTAEAEDAVGDALERAWRSIDALRDPDRFQAWFDRILVNSCRDVLRRRGRVRFVELAIDADHRSPDPFAAVLANDAAWRLVRDLPAEEREIVVLHFWADLTLEAVAERLAIPSGTVKSRLNRALGRLRAGGAR